MMLYKTTQNSAFIHQNTAPEPIATYRANFWVRSLHDGEQNNQKIKQVHSNNICL